MNSLELLVLKYGPVMHSRDVQPTLCYKTAGGFRASRHQGKVNLEMFRIPGRRGLFARTEDVAALLDLVIPPRATRPDEAAQQDESAGGSRDAGAFCRFERKHTLAAPDLQHR